MRIALTAVAVLWLAGQRCRCKLLEPVRVDECGVEQQQVVAESVPAAPEEVRDHLSRCLQQPGPTTAESAAPEPVSCAAARISLEAEVPEALFDGMKLFLQNRPDWDQYRVITSALAGFLFQNGCNDHSVTQHYLNGLFMRAGE